MTPQLVPVYFQPLLWPAGNALLAKVIGQAPSPENLLAFLRGPDSSTVGLQEMQTRYHDLSQYDRLLVAVPNHPTIVRNILVPIHSAKAAYVLEHVVSCLALCGIVCEMLTMFRFEIADPGTKAATGISDEDFARMGQGQRIALLRTHSLVDVRAMRLLEVVRGRRRRYMHFLQKDGRQIAGDAKMVYRATVQLVQIVTGVAITGRAVTFHRDVMRWLKAEGLMEDNPQ